MDAHAFEIPRILMATLTLSIGALLAILALRWLKPTSHKVYRLVWIAVLVNGVILARISVDLPVLEPNLFESSTTLLNTDKALPNSSSPSHQPTDGLAAQKPQSNRMSDTNQEPQTTDSNVASTMVHPNSTSHHSSGISVGNVLEIIWVSGIFVSFCWLIIRYVFFLKTLSTATTASKVWQTENEKVSRFCGQKNPLPLLVHADVGPALTITPQGYKIIVPKPFWNELTPNQRAAVLKHEYAHYQRSDVWKSLLAHLLALPHWFNPFAWLAVKQFDAAAEWACDQAIDVADELEKAGFARALLTLSTSDSTHLVGASAMASTDLSIRVQRLFFTSKRDGYFSRMALALVLAGILSLGWLNIRLVAGTTEPARVTTIQEDEEAILNERAKTLISQLDPEDDTSQQLVTILKSKAGVVALNNRVSWMKEQLQQQAAQDSIPEFYKNVDQEVYKWLDKESAVARDDIQRLAKALTTLNKELHAKSEADQMFSRLLTNKKAPPILYFSEMRKQIRPGTEQVMKRIGRFLADDGNGKFVVRESAREELIKKISQLQSAEQHLSFIKDELKSWSEEVHEKDAMHQMIKQQLAAPISAAIVLAADLENKNIHRPGEQYFERLEWILEDGPEGLTIPDERRPDVEAAIAKMNRELAKLEILYRPIMDIAGRISDENEAEKQVKAFLSSEVGICVLIRSFDYNFATPENIVEQIKNDVMEETPDGWIIRPEMHDEVLGFVRDNLRKVRRFRRETRILNPHIAKLDNEWQSTFNTLEGRAIAVERIESLIATKKIDAWPKWVESHFESIDGKMVQRNEEAVSSINELVQEAKEIEKELDKDDF